MNYANPFDEIADLARVITDIGPDVSAKLAKLGSDLNYCRNQESLQAEVAALRQEIDAWEKCQKDVNARMEKLIRLSGKHLSDVKLHLLTQLPFDRKWDEIVPELNRIHDIALSKALRGDTDNQSDETDTRTENSRIITTAEACKMLGVVDMTLSRRIKKYNSGPNGRSITKIGRGKWYERDIKLLE